MSKDLLPCNFQNLFISKGIAPCLLTCFQKCSPLEETEVKLNYGVDIYVYVCLPIHVCTHISVQMY